MWPSFKTHRAVMGKILRDPGADVIVGLLSFAVSIVANGLALIAVHETIPGFSANWAFVAFGVGGLLD